MFNSKRFMHFSWLSDFLYLPYTGIWLLFLMEFVSRSIFISQLLVLSDIVFGVCLRWKSKAGLCAELWQNKGLSLLTCVCYFVFNFLFLFYFIFFSQFRLVSVERRLWRQKWLLFHVGPSNFICIHLCTMVENRKKTQTK